MKANYATLCLFFGIFPFSVLADTVNKFTLPSGVMVQITEAPFQQSHFKTEGCVKGHSLCRINNRIPFGIAFGLPKTYVKELTISFEKKAYALDVSDMYDAWGTRPLEYKNRVRYFGGKCSGNYCALRGLFSDAAGSFVAEWIIEDGKAIRTILTSTNDVVNLFTKHIDPPEFE